MKRFAFAILFCVSALALAARPAAAEGGPARRTEVRGLVGGRSQFQSGLFSGVPLTFSGAVAVDFEVPVRAELQIMGGPLKSFQTTLSAGVPFRLYDGRESGRSKLELKLPLQVAFSYLRATWEADDGYDDIVRWLLVGPALGIDFTWWVRERLGICLAIDGSYLFRASELDSEYADGTGDPAYSLVDDAVGLGEVVLSIGLAFD
jgi:hypothetical protein